jgi:glycosyltransferase involved in cell wall biosynthesis
VEAPLNGVCFFGAYDRDYPRSRVIRRGLEALGVRVSSCWSPRKLKMPLRYPLLAARYSHNPCDFDVVFVPEFRHKDVPLAAVLARMTAKLCVFDPLVSRYDTRVHDRRDARDGSFQSWHNRNIDAWSMSLADVILADTSAHARYFRREFAPPDAAVEVLPVGYDEAVFSGGGEERSRDDGVIKVLFYGNYLPLHGVDTIVRAAGMLREDDGIQFDLVGAGQTFEGVKEFVDSRSLTRVKLLPRVPFEELPERIADASICLGVFGVTEKTMRVVPNKVYQCMGMDRPVITARSPATEEIFENGVHAELVEPGDAAALAGAIRRLARDVDRRRRIGREAGRLARDRFGSLRIAERFMDICSSALKRSNA